MSTNTTPRRDTSRKYHLSDPVTVNPRFDPIYSVAELSNPPTALLAVCDFNFIKASRSYVYDLNFSGRYDEARALLERLVPAQKHVYGEEDAECMRSVYDLAAVLNLSCCYDEAEELLLPLMALRNRILGPEHQHTINTLSRLASCYLYQHKYAKAEAIFLRCLTVDEGRSGPGDYRSCLNRNSLGLTYDAQGKLELARETYLRALTDLAQHVEPESMDNMMILNNLSRLYDKMGDQDQAQTIRERVLEARVNCEGGWATQHPDTLRVMNGMWSFYQQRNRWKDANSLWMNIYLARKEELGHSHPETFQAQVRVWQTLENSGEYEDALVLADDAVEQRKELMSRSSTVPDLQSIHDMLEAKLMLAISLVLKQDRLSEAEGSFYDLIAVSRELRAQRPSAFLLLQSSGHHYMGRLLQGRGKLDDAISHWREAVRCCQDFPEQFEMMQKVAIIEGLVDALNYLEPAPLGECEVLIQEAIKASEVAYGPSSEETAMQVSEMRFCLTLQARWAESLPYFRHAIPILEKFIGPKFRTLVDLKSAAIAARYQGELDEALSYSRRTVNGFEELDGLMGESTVRAIKFHLDILEQMGYEDESEEVIDYYNSKGLCFRFRGRNDNITDEASIDVYKLASDGLIIPF